MTTPYEPHAIIEVDGERWDSWVDRQLFMSLGVELTTNAASQATWKILDPKFFFIDKFSEAEGVRMLDIKAWLGFGHELGEPVFKGLLASVERGSKATTLRAYDMGFRMRLKKRAQHHNRATDVEIIDKLARRNGLEFEGPSRPFGARNNAVTQDSRTDWEHATELAREAGLVLYVRGDTLFAKEPATVGEAKLTLRYGQDFTIPIHHDFALVFNLPENVEGKKQTEVRGRGRGGRRLSGHSEAGPRGHESVEFKRDLKGSSQSVADRRAKARRDLEREHAFNLSVSSVPPPADVRPDVRDTIRLAGVGMLFSGLYLVDAVSHQLSGGSFSTGYTLFRDVKEM